MSKRRSGEFRRHTKPGPHRLQFLWLILLCAMLLLPCTPLYATEGGGSTYVGGNEDFMAGALPPAGMYPIVYGLYYGADALNDNNGTEQPIDFKLDVYATVFRFIHVTELKILGADFGWHVIVPFVDQNLEIGVAGIDESETGLGDIEFSPMILAWHLSKNLHLIAALDFMAPTGAYDINEPASIGRNYWTIDPVFAVTYLSDGGFEVSGKFQYLMNTENSDTEYTSGNEFILDYLVGQHVGGWNFGINGYLYQQITSDAEGINPATGNPNQKVEKGRCISIGPAIQYNYKNMFFNAKYQWDTAVKNRPEGQKLWLKFMYAF